MKLKLMEGRLQHTRTVIAAASLLLASVCQAQAERTVRLDAGSVIPVRLNEMLSSGDSHKGDSFTATVKSVDAEGYGLPSGTKIDGIVTGARPQRDKDPGVLEVSFDRIRLPDGHSYAIDGSLIGLDNKSVDRRADGRLVAKPSHRNDRLTYAGYGAGAGLIVGLLTKRPLEDALLGGLLGYGFSALQKGHSDARDVVLKPGTEMGVRVDRGATLTLYNDAGGVRDNIDATHDQYYDSHANRSYNGNGTSGHERDTADGYRVSADRRDYGVGSSARSDERDPATSDIGLMVDDRDVRFDTTAMPFIGRNNVVMVPAAPVFKAARIPYEFDSRSQSLRATGTDEPARISIGSSIAVLNGRRRVRLDAPAQRINGTMYVPMRFLELATGYKVNYDAPSRTVVMTSH